MKESDRLTGTAELVRAFGAGATVEGDDLVVEGTGAAPSPGRGGRPRRPPHGHGRRGGRGGLSAAAGGDHHHRLGGRGHQLSGLRRRPRRLPARRRRPVTGADVGPTAADDRHRRSGRIGQVHRVAAPWRPARHRPSGHRGHVPGRGLGRPRPGRSSRATPTAVADVARDVEHRRGRPGAPSTGPTSPRPSGARGRAPRSRRWRPTRGPRGPGRTAAGVGGRARRGSDRGARHRLGGASPRRPQDLPHGLGRGAGPSPPRGGGRCRGPSGPDRQHPHGLAPRAWPTGPGSSTPPTGTVTRSWRRWYVAVNAATGTSARTGRPATAPSTSRSRVDTSFTRVYRFLRRPGALAQPRPLPDHAWTGASRCRPPAR